jgi:hypothetical protein
MSMAVFRFFKRELRLTVIYFMVSAGRGVAAAA